MCRSGESLAIPIAFILKPKPMDDEVEELYLGDCANGVEEKTASGSE
jgi:hypothetical protein